MAQIFPDDTSSLHLYFDDIVSSEPLSREREVELSARIQEGDLGARDELVRANLRFVIDVAKSYQNRGLSLADLISAGNVGLVTAADRFDGARGFKFISYAVWWIRQSIMQSIAEHSRTVRLPLNKLSLLKDITQVARRLGQGREAEPDVEEIAAELDVGTQEVLDTMLSARAVRSLDECFQEDDDRSLLSVLVDERQQAPDVGVLDEVMQEQIDGLLETLDERERYILRLYFGFGGEEPLTLEQIGGLMQLTRERVRQLKERALSKLREPGRCHTLLSLVDEAEAI